MEFDSKLQVFAVYVSYMIMDSPYMCHTAVLDCVPQLCQGSHQVFWSLTINPLLQSILKGNSCGNLPSISRYETGTTVSKQLENQFLKTCTLVLCIFLLPSTPSSVHSLGILSLWDF